LYASRRTNSFGDHITLLLKSLLEAPELPDAYDSKEKLGHSDQRVVSYIQATSQVTLNLASMQNPDDFL
jgi:hypothetical protein